MTTTTEALKLARDALAVADRAFAENGLLACHAARDEIRAAIDALAQPQPSAPSVEPAPTRADEFDRMLSTLRYVLNAGQAKDGETARDHYCAIINSIAGRAERTEAADVRFACEAVKRAALHFGAAPAPTPEAP